MESAVMEAPGVAPLNLSESGSWLCNKHGMLRALVEQIGSWDDGAPVMHRVRDVVIEYDRFLVSPVPVITQAVAAIVVMAPSEISRLRMLATLAPNRLDGSRVQFSIRDLEPFTNTEDGRALVEDYLHAVRAVVLG